MLACAGRLGQAVQEDRQHNNEVLDLGRADSGGRRMSSVPTARIAIGNLQAETGLAFQMVYLEDSGQKQCFCGDSDQSSHCS
jgi:hypothetical protein